MGFELPFPKFLAKTDIQVYYEGTDEYGEYIDEKIYEGKCIYTDKAKQILNEERQLINLSGKVVIEGKIYEEQFQGYVMIGSVKKKVYSAERPLNPDGSIFSTELNLI